MCDRRRGWAMILLGALLPLTTSVQGGQLDGLEMDVLGPGELPGESMPRIPLPESIGHGERLELGIGGRAAGEEFRLRLESSEAALESSSAFSDRAPPRPPAPVPLPEPPAKPEGP